MRRVGGIPTPSRLPCKDPFCQQSNLDSAGKLISFRNGTGQTTDLRGGLAPVAARPRGGTTNYLTLTFAYNSTSQINSTPRSNDLYAWTGYGIGTTSATIDGLNRLTSPATRRNAATPIATL